MLSMRCILFSIFFNYSFNFFVSLPEESLTEKYDYARKRFEREYDERKAKEEKKIGLKIDDNASTHQRVKLKQHELNSFANALRIVDSNYNEGDAFDEKVQLAKKQSRMQEKFEKEKDRLKVLILYVAITYYF
jgi:hypothetical protein